MTIRPRPKLLVSVRSPDEARAALAGGADVIDVKEPARGPLGAADPDVILNVLGAVNGRVPVSAALGEWASWPGHAIPAGLQYAKWGTAGLMRLDARSILQMRFTSCALFPVLTAYADHQLAGSPDADALAAVAIRYRFPAFLIDTAVKDGSTLLDRVAPAALARLRFRLADAGVAVAFAGSLDESAIRMLAPLEPDWFAVRRAACEGGRSGSVCADRVRRLRAVIDGGTRAIAG